MIDYPEKFENEDQLEDYLSRPGEELIDMIGKTDGDIMILGITGKIGPSLALMAARACEKAGLKKKILGVSRHIDAQLQKNLDQAGIESVRGDLLDSEFLKRLPLFKNVFYLAGMKFGSADDQPLTWAINTYLPGMVAGHFKNSRIVAFSTGCVYPLVTPASGGSLETDTPFAMGEYAQSCIGRERLFEYGSSKFGTQTILLRLNYSVEMRYGVLSDIAVKVKNQIPVDLSMGYFNVIWQGDMNDLVLRSLNLGSSPAAILNITGPETLSVRETAMQFGEYFGIAPVFINEEAPTALLNNASRAFELLGKPKVAASQLIKWTAEWMKDNGRLLGKPTHFEVRDGIY
ncbi:MAG TPA: NAD-dependent epimerase/dehydratase family protein [Bacteroidales bacterium]|nr:NAD-dependent epimerase/dehydratase family protein [Bacteroidales bacterium]